MIRISKDDLEPIPDISDPLKFLYKGIKVLAYRPAQAYPNVVQLMPINMMETIPESSGPGMALTVEIDVDELSLNFSS